MNPPRANAEDYISHLMVDPSEFTATEMARCVPFRPDSPAHDAFTRLLHRLDPDTEPLWKEVESVIPEDGILVIDDTVLDKPHARHMGLVSRFWSGRHKRVVRGINLVTALWTNGDALWPFDYRLVDKSHDKLTKNQHFQNLVQKAYERGLKPKYVGFDSWYASAANLKHVNSLGWKYLTQVKSNRKVNPDNIKNRCISECEISQTGTIVHLKDVGFVKAFRIVSKDGHTEHWITNDLEMDELGRLKFAELAWGIEEYHRGLKQHTGVEDCQTRMAKAQRNHIGFSIRAFLRLEWLRFSRGLNWFEGKRSFIREAIRVAIANLIIGFPQPATA